MHHRHAENNLGFVGKGLCPKPRLELRNIKDFFPSDQLSKYTVSMDISELPSLNCVVDKPKLKLRQTARKSTNSKLKLSMSCTEQSENSNNQDEVHSHTNNCSNSLSNKITQNDSKHSGISSNGCLDLVPVNEMTNSLKDPKVNPIKLKLKDIMLKNGTSTSISSPGIVKNDYNSEHKVESLKLKLKPVVCDGENLSKPPIKIFLSNVSSCPTIQKPSNCEKTSELKPCASDLLDKTLTEKKSDFIDTSKKSDLKVDVAADKKILSSESHISTSSLHQSPSNKSTDHGHGGNLKRSIENDISPMQSDHKKSKLLKDDQPPINEFVNPLHGTEIKGDEKNDKENKGYVSNDSSVDVKWIEFKPDIEKFIREQCQKEIELQLKLEKKNARYTKLKEKYDSLEETLRSWIKFADDLQTRVRKMAMHFQRQAESVKVLKARNSVLKASVGIQTDKVFEENTLNNDLKSMLNDSHFRKNYSPLKVPNCKDNSLKLSTSKTSSPVAKTSDVIDLTGETESQNSDSTSNINREVRKILQLPNAKNAPPTKVFQNKIVPRTSLEKSPSDVLRDNLQLPPRNVANTTNIVPRQRPVLSQQIIRPIPSSYRMTSNLPRAETPAGHFRLQSNVVKNLPSPPRSSLPYPPLPSAPTASYVNRIPRNALGPPPELQLGIKREGRNGGIVLSWSNRFSNVTSAKVVGYELYAFHQSNDKREWRKIGDDTIKAMDLPMACTLSQFSSNCVYYFAVRGKDVFGRFGPFSIPCSSKDVT